MSLSEQPIPESLKWAHLYLMATHDEAQSKKQREELRDKLRPWLTESFEADEDGNYFYEFPKPINLDGIWYTGLMAQRRVSEFVDDERANTLIYKYGLANRCLRRVETFVIDYDELYAANQEGIVPDEDIDSIIDYDVNYALVKVKK